MSSHVRIRIEAAVGLFIIFILFFVVVSSRSAAHLWLFPLDTAAASFFAGLRTPLLTSIMLFATYLGNWQVVVTIETLVVCILFVTHRRSAIPLSVAMVVVGQVVAWGFKYLSDRSRPDVFNMLQKYGSDSFPSGHALVGVLLYGTIAYLISTKLSRHWPKVVVWVVGIGVGVLVGLSRVYLGVHWFSDVVGGFLLGGILLIVLILFLEHADSLNGNLVREPKKRLTLLFIAALLLVEGFFLYQFYKSHPLPTSSYVAKITSPHISS